MGNKNRRASTDATFPKTSPTNNFQASSNNLTGNMGFFSHGGASSNSSDPPTNSRALAFKSERGGTLKPHERHDINILAAGTPVPNVGINRSFQNKGKETQIVAVNTPYSGNSPFMISPSVDSSNYYTPPTEILPTNKMSGARARSGLNAQTAAFVPSTPTPGPRGRQPIPLAQAQAQDIVSAEKLQAFTLSMHPALRPGGYVDPGRGHGYGSGGVTSLNDHAHNYYNQIATPGYFHPGGPVQPPTGPKALQGRATDGCSSHYGSGSSTPQSQQQEPLVYHGYGAHFTDQEIAQGRGAYSQPQKKMGGRFSAPHYQHLAAGQQIRAVPQLYDHGRSRYAQGTVDNNGCSMYIPGSPIHGSQDIRHQAGYISQGRIPYTQGQDDGRCDNAQYHSMNDRHKGYSHRQSGQGYSRYSRGILSQGQTIYSPGQGTLRGPGNQPPGFLPQGQSTSTGLQTGSQDMVARGRYIPLRQVQALQACSFAPPPPPIIQQKSDEVWVARDDKSARDLIISADRITRNLARYSRTYDEYGNSSISSVTINSDMDFVNEFKSWDRATQEEFCKNNFIEIYVPLMNRKQEADAMAKAEETGEELVGSQTVVEKLGSLGPEFATFASKITVSLYFPRETREGQHLLTDGDDHAASVSGRPVLYEPEYFGTGGTISRPSMETPNMLLLRKLVNHLETYSSLAHLTLLLRVPSNNRMPVTMTQLFHMLPFYNLSFTGWEVYYLAENLTIPLEVGGWCVGFVDREREKLIWDYRKKCEAEGKSVGAVLARRYSLVEAGGYGDGKGGELTQTRRGKDLASGSRSDSGAGYASDESWH